MANFDLDRDSVQETDTKTDIIQEEETTVSDTTEMNTKKKEVNDVRITITDDKTPIVILFGPPACGKTMTLIRLSHYLNTQHYSITPDRKFRPSDDQDYKHLCDKFEKDLNNNTAADANNNMDFMLVKVHRRGEGNICQILEAAGELYFKPDEPKKKYPVYLNQIGQAKNRKIWVIFLDPELENNVTREAYVDRIKGLYGKTIATTDRVIFLGNKADTADDLIRNRIINAKKYREYLSSKTGGGLYPEVFDTFKEEHFFKRIFKPYKCDFLPFSTGSYDEDNTQVVDGDDTYPEKLWNMILKRAGKKW